MRQFNEANQQLLAIGLGCAVLIGLIAVVPNGMATAPTGECEVRMVEKGHVTEEVHKASCSFECKKDDYITVEVVNLKGRGRVNIVGDCGGGRAECEAVRACAEQLGTLATEDQKGECRAQVTHIAKLEKIFRCKAIPTQGAWASPPVYAFCVVHWLNAWLFGDGSMTPEGPSPIQPGPVGSSNSVVEVCYYEGDKVCFDLPATFYLSEPIPWAHRCLPPDLESLYVWEEICEALDGSNGILCDPTLDGQVRV